MEAGICDTWVPYINLSAFCISAVLWGATQELVVICICTCLVTDDTNHLFICLPVIYMTYLPRAGKWFSGIALA